MRAQFISRHDSKLISGSHFVGCCNFHSFRGTQWGTFNPIKRKCKMGCSSTLRHPNSLEFCACFCTGSKLGLCDSQFLVTNGKSRLSCANSVKLKSGYDGVHRRKVWRTGAVMNLDEAVERESKSTADRDSYDAIVIGSGIGGLVAATQLAVKGAKVLVLEKYVIPGGSSGFYERDGYTFDVGSSVMFGFSDKDCVALHCSSPDVRGISCLMT